MAINLNDANSAQKIVADIKAAARKESRRVENAWHVLRELGEAISFTSAAYGALTSWSLNDHTADSRKALASEIERLRYVATQVAGAFGITDLSGLWDNDDLNAIIAKAV